MYLLPAADGHDDLIAVPIIKVTGNPVRVPVTLKPYDLTYDRLVLRLFVRQSETIHADPVVLVNGRTCIPESVGDKHFRGTGDVYRMLTVAIELGRREAIEFIERPMDVQIEFPPGGTYEVLVSNDLSDQPHSSRLYRSTAVNPRQLIYIFQFVFLLMAGFSLLLITDYNFFDFPAAVSAPFVPILLFLFGDYLNRTRLRAISTRYIYRLQLQYRAVFVALLLGSVVLAVLLADRIRCEWTNYRYQSVFKEFVHAMASRDEPVAKLARLVSIAPERRENLHLLQYLLWTHRHDDSLASVENDTPVGFARPVVAKEFLKRLDPEVRAALERGESPGCGCVEDLSTDDPRFLWIFALEESMGTITERNMEILEEIIRYIKNLIEEQGATNQEFRVLLHRYEVVYYSHIPKIDNVDQKNAMKELQKYVDVQNSIRPSIFEIAVDQLADSAFLGYCDVELGLQQYQRLFDIRRYNVGTEVLREFPPQKLTAFRLIKLFEGKDDYFDRQLKKALEDDCGPDGETLEELFEAEFIDVNDDPDAPDIPPAGLSADDWIRGTPADPNFLQALTIRTKEGWKR